MIWYVIIASSIPPKLHITSWFWKTPCFILACAASSPNADIINIGNAIFFLGDICRNNIEKIKKPIGCVILSSIINPEEAITSLPKCIYIKLVMIYKIHIRVFIKTPL